MAGAVQDENDEAALLRWACAPLRTAEFFHEQDVKSLIPGTELSAACSNLPEQSTWD
jgi:hypothetical protein